MTSSSPIWIREPSGALWRVAPNGVVLAGRRVPPEWAREVRRLFLSLEAPVPPPARARPALRLLAPDPGDAAVFDPPVLLRWSALPGIERYQLSVEALTDPVEHRWSLVQDLSSREVTGAEFEVPTEMRWAPGAVYRWRVQTADGRAAAAGRFRVLSEGQRERLQAARQSAGNSHLLRAVIYRSFGLYDAALTELQALRGSQREALSLQPAILQLQADIRRQRAAADGELSALR